MSFDVFSVAASEKAGRAAKAADTNLNASIALLQMISEMRDFQHRRFNDVIDA